MSTNTMTTYSMDANISCEKSYLCTYMPEFLSSAGQLLSGLDSRCDPQRRPSLASDLLYYPTEV